MMLRFPRAYRSSAQAYMKRRDHELVVPLA
jgi:hypothetical protein